MSSEMVRVGGLHIHKLLYEFIEKEVIQPPQGCDSIKIDCTRFWAGLESAVKHLTPECEALLLKRESLQRQIDDWHLTQRGDEISQKKSQFDPAAYKNFLYRIGYLVEEGPDFEIVVNDVDPEISSVAGPQLVVPLTNARFALNAANARWGSLFDALYGTDIISEDNGLEKQLQNSSGRPSYNPLRGEAVVRYAVNFLDTTFPLTSGSYAHIKEVSLSRQNGHCAVNFRSDKNEWSPLQDPSMFVGYTGNWLINSGQPSSPISIVLKHHNLHVELQFDRSDERAVSQHPAALKDVIIESALTTIQDCEDSVSVVDAEDKISLYRNWLGLMIGNLSVTLSQSKNKRTLMPDKHLKDVYGHEIILPGRSLMLIRNVGHHMFTDIVTNAQTNQPIPEGFLDAFVTSLISLYDINRIGTYRNSRCGSLYIVKPKQHGPEEVKLTNALFGMVEHTLGLPHYTIKLGLMDEERRTSCNLKACVREAYRRTIFINTGFLDRTGDEIHTSFEYGPFDLKDNLRKGAWITAYEKQNVHVGLACGFYQKGQIGKGMWAEPDGMKAMLEQKIAHTKSGATTAWVPSPTAATLHALHYHKVNVKEVQQQLLNQIMNEAKNKGSSKQNLYLDDILKIQVLDHKLSDQEIQRELENNLQGLLGYVVRWIDQGVGCSKVPNINGVGLMEDRATLRISAQHVANWLHHHIVDENQVFETLRKMAAIVDKQNAKDPGYKPMESQPFTSISFQAALDLIYKGATQPSGYTEFILHKRRREAKGKINEMNEFLMRGPSARWSKM